MPATTTAARHDRRRWFALLVVCLAMLMNALDQTIVNVALPDIQMDLHFTQAGLAWVVDAYLITFGGTLLLAGRLGDLFGRRRMFLIGVLVFTAASAVCGASVSDGMLIAARFVQGVGAALSASVILAIIVAEFPEAGERARATSYYVFVAISGGAVGLLVGGALTEALGWHWIFFINVPIGVATLVLGRMLIDENEGIGVGAGLDVGGAVLSTAGMMAGVYAIVAASEYGWLSARTLGAGAIAVVLLAAFAILESRLRAPLMPLRILKSKGLLSSSLVRGLAVMGMFSVFFIGVLYLQKVLGYSTLETGLAYLPMTLTAMAMALGVTARLIKRFGPRPMVLVGLVMMLVGLVLFTQVGEHTSFFPLLLVASVLAGAGAPTAFTPLLTIAVSDVPTADAGLGSGVVNMTQQLATAIGVAVLGTIAEGKTTQLVAEGHSMLSSLTSAYHLAFEVAVGFVVAAMVCAIVLIRSPKKPVVVPAPDLAADGEAVPVVIPEP